MRKYREISQWKMGIISIPYKKLIFQSGFIMKPLFLCIREIAPYFYDATLLSKSHILFSYKCTINHLFSKSQQPNCDISDRIKCNGICLLVLNLIIYVIYSIVKKENTFSTCFAYTSRTYANIGFCNYSFVQKKVANLFHVLSNSQFKQILAFFAI